MGWLSGWKTRGELIRHIKEQGVPRRFWPKDEWNERACWHTNTLLASCAVGNDMWTVWEVTREYAESSACPITETVTEKVIVLFMLRGGRNQDWGYKDVSESMGPCQLSCPLTYLDMAPQAKGPFAGCWRERVRAFHARTGMKLVVGDRVKLLENIKCGICRITSVRPLRGQDEKSGIIYRIPRKVLAEKV